jgi:hypothetical protein
MRRALVALFAGLALVGPAGAATTPKQPVYDARGNIIATPFAPAREAPRLNEQRATRYFLHDDKVESWLDRYPTRGRSTEATFDEDARTWRVKVWSGEAGQIADGRVEDATGRVSEAWTGPQVAWKMARGSPGAFGGRELNRTSIWLVFCALFFFGLADLRRPLAVRNLDLLALLSFSVSLWFFNKGDIFTSAPLAYPPLLYLIGRCVWIAARGRNGSRQATLWPAWILLGATVFLAGFRVGLNIQSSNVIDVGFSGVVGAHRITNGESPYGHMPVEGDRKPCGPADAEGEIRERVQTNGRCESANERGDTYGPVSYLAYVPGFLAFGWSGKWDKLPAAHATSIAFDLLCILGLALVGLRFGGAPLAAALAFAWVAYPFTQYASNANTNDSILPAFLIFGFWLVSSPWARGASVALAAWTKFAALLLAPAWLAYPRALPKPRPTFAYAGGFALASAAAFSILLLEPDPGHAARVFYDRTIGWQLGRESPFSIWDWRQYHARGIPDLHLVQQALKVLVVIGAVVAGFVPRRRSPLQLAAITAALLLGFELVLTHWFYLYIPWFFPFVAIAVIAPAARAATSNDDDTDRASSPAT